MAPAARIPRGPVYSLAFTLVALLLSSGEVSIYGVVFSIYVLFQRSGKGDYLTNCGPKSAGWLQNSGALS